MTPRPLPHVVGHFAWIRYVPANRMFGGLTRDQLVFILAIVPPSSVLVKDSGGKSHLVAASDLDSGYEFLLDTGKWVHESDPEAACHIRRLTASVPDMPPPYRELLARIKHRNERLYATEISVAN